VHGLEDLLGDGLGLDERDETELGVALFADDLKPESFSEKLWQSFGANGWEDC
jgi:hypothetical protein